MEFKLRGWILACLQPSSKLSFDLYFLGTFAVLGLNPFATYQFGHLSSTKQADSSSIWTIF